MTSTWTTRAFSGSKKSAIFEMDESLLEEEVVILLQGKNHFGDRIYAYVKLTVRNLKELKSLLDANGKFTPSDYGAVIAAGKGDPSDEVKSEMAITYNMWDVVPRAPVEVNQPKLWGEESA